jgi:threonine aldolase
LVQKMADEGVLVSGRGDELRLVTHFDFKQEQVDLVAAAFVRALAA